MEEESFDVDALIDGLIEREGGYVNHPADKGGPTCFGITEAVARAHGYAGAMRNLPRMEAAAIYRRLYCCGRASTRSRSDPSGSPRSCSIPASTWAPRWRRLSFSMR